MFIVGNLQPPIPREYDEFGHHCDDPAFCAYTFEELLEPCKHPIVLDSESYLDYLSQIEIVL